MNTSLFESVSTLSFHIENKIQVTFFSQTNHSKIRFRYTKYTKSLTLHVGCKFLSNINRFYAFFMICPRCSLSPFRKYRHQKMLYERCTCPSILLRFKGFCRRCVSLGKLVVDGFCTNSNLQYGFHADTIHREILSKCILVHAYLSVHMFKAKTGVNHVSGYWIYISGNPHRFRTNVTWFT